MSLDINGINQIFKNAYSDKLDLYFNPKRADELKEYLVTRDLEIKLAKEKSDARREKINQLENLEVGKYKIKLINEIFDYGTSLGKPGEIIEVFNHGNTWSGGSLNRNQDHRALNFDYGMSGADCYFPTIDFEIIEYLGL